MTLETAGTGHRAGTTPTVRTGLSAAWPRRRGQSLAQKGSLKTSCIFTVSLRLSQENLEPAGKPSEKEKDSCFVSDRVYLSRLAYNWLVILPQPLES